MATYNGQPFISEQVESILGEMGPYDELVISDNGSSDGTLAYLDSLEDERVKLIHCTIPGVISNFENAIGYAEGEYIILSDQDDVWLAGRLQKALKALTTADLSAVSLFIVDEKLNLTGKKIAPRGGFLATLIRNSYPGCSLAFRREVLDWVLPFPKQIAMHDWWIVLICLARGKVDHTGESYILYRRHGGNASDTGEKSNFSRIQQLMLRINMLICLLRRYLANRK